MKSKFRHFRRPDEREFEALWRDATVVLDANVLLNAYRYSDKTRRELFALLRRLNERLWIPYQAALEFHQRRPSVMLERRSAFAEVRQSIEQSTSSLKERLSTLYRDAAINADALMREVQDAQQKLVGELAERERKETVEPTSSPRDDPIWRAVLEMFDGRTGDPYDAANFDAVCRDAETRMAQGKPPGYADKHKGGLEQFGDYIIWRQMLDFAKASKQSMLFVTDDRKEDWWLKAKEKTIGPRPELVAEMKSDAGVAFYMYQPVQFMQYAAEQLKAKVSAAALGEVRDLAPRRPSHEEEPRTSSTAPSDLLRRRLRFTYERFAAARHELAEVEGLLNRETQPETRVFLGERHRQLQHDVRRYEEQLLFLERRMDRMAREWPGDAEDRFTHDRVSRWATERIQEGGVEIQPHELDSAVDDAEVDGSAEG